MRVITGAARGRRLKEPAGLNIRPTTDRVKEAMFNICQDGVESWRVLDLFGGTGQLGIEAKSRGAGEVTIEDSDKTAVALIRENVRLTGLEIRVVRGDALSFLRQRGSVYDLIFLDPPYGSGLAESALKMIKSFDKLSFGGIIICETDAFTTVLPEMEPPYLRLREYRYGKVKLTTYTKLQ